MPVRNLRRVSPRARIIIPTDSDVFGRITITQDDGTVHTVLDSYGGASEDNHTLSAKCTKVSTDKLGSFSLKISNDSGRFVGKFNGGEVVQIYADTTDATTLIFRGKIDDPKYGVNISEGFFIDIDGRDYPEMIDKTITGVEASVTPGVSLAGILNEFFPDTVLNFWNGSKWVEAVYDSGSDTIAWSSEAANFPTTAINMTYQHRKGWNVMAEIVRQSGLDSYLEYGDSDYGMPTGSHASGLVSFWRLNGNVLDSVSDNDGTVTDAETTTAGYKNGAYTFNGTSAYIDLDNPTELQFDEGNGQTISAWIKGTGNDEYIYSKRNDSNGALSFFIASDGKLAAIKGTTVQSTKSTGTVDDGEWHHVALVYNGSEVKYYIDGSPSGGDSSLSGTWNNSVNALIGFRVSGSAQHYYTGTLDEVGIWNRALTADEISDLYDGKANFAWRLRTELQSTKVNTNSSVAYGMNLLTLGGYGAANSDITNRVIVYGKTESDNILLLKTENDDDSQSNLWIKDQVITEPDLGTMADVQSKANSELTDGTTLTNSGKITSIMLPDIRPGEMVTASVPYCTINGTYRCSSYTHTFGRPFQTSFELTRRIKQVSDLFIPKVNPEEFISALNNPNAMTDSYSVYFDEDPTIMSHSGTEEVEGRLRLQSTETTGISTSNFITTDQNVAQCEFRRYENFETVDDVYEVSNDEGATWETYNPATAVHTFLNVGNKLGFRMTLNRDATSATSPSYESVALLYK